MDRFADLGGAVADEGAARDQGDAVLAALDELVTALRENISANTAAIERAETIAGLRRGGLAYTAIADETGRPLVVELISENTQRLHTHGARLRRAQAAALHGEGMTMDRIAELFGVSRQRISAILREVDT